MLKIVVGPVASNTVEAVGVCPDDGGSDIDAEACGMTVLRAQGVVEAYGESKAS
ncbi:hypothetical protein ACFQ12_08955 [Methylobacterium trifolii]